MPHFIDSDSDSPRTIEHRVTAIHSRKCGTSDRRRAWGGLSLRWLAGRAKHGMMLDR